MPFRVAACGIAWVRDFLQTWEMEIRLRDPCNFEAHGSEDHEANVYQYLEQRLLWVLDHTRNIGEAGWAFQTDGAGRWTWAIIYADASSSEQQEKSVEVATGLERWWPALVADIPGLDKLPVYCPGLAWQYARPWFVHRSRVQLLPRAAL